MYDVGAFIGLKIYNVTRSAWNCLESVKLVKLMTLATIWYSKLVDVSGKQWFIRNIRVSIKYYKNNLQFNLK